MILQKLIVLILIAQTTAVHCPVGCICTQGTVNCVQRELSTIPIIPSDALIVDLRYNKIEAIESKCFESLLSLHTIFLNDNRIGLIENNAFLTLPEVRYLFLNNNRISQISPDAFIGLQQLQSLHLQNNDIWELNSNPFHSLQQLRELFLFNNKITKIPEQTFSNLPQLMRLNLDNNPIECDCGVHSILKKFKGTQKDTEIFLTCSSPPNLFGKSFNILDESDFHCKTPTITQESHDVEALIGENVEITCEADGDPQPYISWIQNSNEVIPQNPRLHVLPNGSLNIVDVKEEDEGVYECKARNLVGETKSRPVRMAVKRNYHGQLERPKFSVSPRNLYVLKNEPINLDCTATGTPTPEISWYFNERHLAQSTDQIRIFSNGTLVIPFATKRYEGIYTCKASSSTDTIESSAHVQVGELPEIILAPQNQIMKVGETLVLECDAEGSPPPKIEWKHNNTTLASSPAATNRITIQNENTEVLIQFIKESDSGHYTCIAENINGKVEATATIIIENNRRPPHLIFEPYNTEAVSGTTIELPCKGDGNPPPQVKWRKDGRLIAPFPDKYEISKSGSLFIINFTEVDNGRYECSLYNEYGRATAQGLVTLRNNEVLPLGDRFVKVAFVEASREIDLAINNTVKSLFAPHPQNTSFNHGNLFHIFRFPTGEARQIARAAEIYERTLVNIRKHIKSGANLTMISKEYEYKELLSQEHLHLVAELSGCMTHRRVPNCTDMCFHSKYRTIDGTCNNLNNPTWGASLTAFRRLSQPIYENGFSMPIGWTKGKLYHGFPKPSARFISTELISTKGITSDNRITHMVMQWGQFLDHDLDHAIPSVSSESWDGIDCKKTCEYAPPCYPIEVPPNDPRIRNRRCIDLVRSSAICGSGMTSVFFDSVQPREQINQLTSYIDASQVYGYSDHFAQELRNLTSDIGVLRTGVAFPNQKDMLPFSAPQDGIDCRRNTVESNINCFVAGDIRANEQVGLLAMHVIFMREHNRIAIKLKEINPHWTGDNLYEEARKIVGAQMQHITYKQWMPLILGPQGMDMLSEYTGYNPNINPTISNEFATAAMRFGHSLINPILHRLNENFQPIPQGHLHLHNAFFAPWRLVYEGGVDPLLRGMFHTPAKLKLPNQNLNAELTEKLFFTAHAVALDLAAINIQRGREHGIPAYNEYRKICNMSFAKTFDDLKHEISSEEIRKKLKNIYGHPSNIDLWVGGILEDQVEGGKVGPLFRCLLVEQFKKLRDGDRFYYENPSVFTAEQLQEIKKSSFSRILCDNGDNITKVTQNVFLLPNAKEDYRECWSIPGVNLYFWQDCGTCNSIPPLLNTYVPEIYHRPKRAAHFSEQNNKTYEINNLLSMNEQRVSGLEEIISTFQNEIIEMKKKLRNLEETCNNENSKYHQHHCKDSLGTKRLYNETWFEDECTKCQCKSSGVLCKTEHCAQIACPADSKPFKVPGSCCTHCSKI